SHTGASIYPLLYDSKPINHISKLFSYSLLLLCLFLSVNMGSEGGGGELIVKVSKREAVAAVLPLQEHWLPLSNLDLLLPPVDVGVFFCYKKNTSLLGKDLSNNFGSMVGVLKKALAHALVTYYAFAGEVVSNPVGEPEILCNNRGVDFVEAFAEAELKDLDLYNPDDTIEGKLVPKKKHGVLAVQANRAQVWWVGCGVHV
ncbi:omega-hydroxypalmitate o-feruloyl transferase, partial [Quercus suber]